MLKGKILSKFFWKTVLFMVYIRNLNRNFSKVETRTGTETFQKSEPDRKNSHGSTTLPPSLIFQHFP